MTDMQTQVASGSLLNGPAGAKKPSESTIAQVAKDFGVHPLRQMLDILAMRIGRQKLGSEEYYNLLVFDPIHDKAARKTFLGQSGMNAFNDKINAAETMETKNILGNKLIFGHHLEAAGLPTTCTQAIAISGNTSGHALVLSSATDIITFLRERAQYPLFGKPDHGSLSVGSALIERREGDNLILAGNKTVSIEKFASDVLRVYPEGYLLQTALRPHKDMQRISGNAVGCVRLVSGHDGTEASPIYAVWKIPEPGAFSDNFWQKGSMLGLINLTDGIVENCHRGTGPSAEMLRNHPVSGLPVPGFQIPYWEDLMAVAKAAHELFPDLAMCGFDIAVTDDGPVIVECNDRPSHMKYQLAARKGMLNPGLNESWQTLMKRPA